MNSRNTTLDVALNRGNNSFGFIRLLLAVLVITSHSWTIGGFGAEPLVKEFGGISLGLFAVSGFFSLSGLLVGFSAERSSGSSYFRQRAARIFPGYWVALIMSGITFGVLISLVRGLDLRYVLFSPKNESVRTYVVNNFPISATQYKLGRVLDGLPYPHGINGSLWSLPYEFACYLLIFVVIKWCVVSNRAGRVLALILLSSFTIAILSNKSSAIFVGVSFPILGTLDSRLFFNLWLTFLAGAVMAHLRRRITITLARTLVSAVLVAISLAFGMFWPWGVLVLPMAIVGTAYHLPRIFRCVGEKTDISYGMYLYGFPVGQLIVAITEGNSGSALLLAILTTLVTVPFAYASWIGIERLFILR